MKEELTKLVVQVQPNARRNELLGFKQEVLKIRIAAPPSKGKANQELINYLSDILGIAKNRIIIQHGNTSKKKIIVIEGLNQDRLLAIVAGWLNENESNPIEN
jgi:uncharacterized protein (TIGR00251 family)